MTVAERLLSEDGDVYCEAWNFGPDSDSNATVSEVTQKIGSVWGDAMIEHLTPDGLPHESGMLRLDATKASMRLGWRPRWPLDRAVEETVAWYKAWLLGEDLRAFTLGQISSYEDEA